MPYRALLARAGLLLVLGGVLAALCYFLVDRPVAHFVHDRHFSRLEVLKWLTYLPTYLEAAAPWLIVLPLVRRAAGPLTRLETTLLAASLCLIVTEEVRMDLAPLFGRYWPETWVDNNPSLIGNNAYGFHPFHWGRAFESFPSGHTARTVAFVSVFWLSFPRLVWLGVPVCAAVVAALVGMDYHFVGDTVAGATLGLIAGMYAAQLAGLRGQAAPLMRPAPNGTSPASTR